MAGSSGFVEQSGTGRQWYDLFSRGARDWLRHNDKVRAAVREKLPELIAGSELLPRADSTVQVPVRFLEHARLKLREPEQSEGVGQGEAKPGDRVPAPAEPRARQRCRAATRTAASSSSWSSRSTTSSTGSGKS